MSISVPGRCIYLPVRLQSGGCTHPLARPGLQLPLNDPFCRPIDVECGYTHVRFAACASAGDKRMPEKSQIDNLRPYDGG